MSEPAVNLGPIMELPPHFLFFFMYLICRNTEIKISVQLFVGAIM